jgi:hypothetical protein
LDDIDDEAKALKVIEELAEKTGRTITVKRSDGSEI